MSSPPASFPPEQIAVLRAMAVFDVPIGEHYFPVFCLLLKRHAPRLEALEVRSQLNEFIRQGLAREVERVPMLGQVKLSGPQLCKEVQMAILLQMHQEKILIGWVKQIGGILQERSLRHDWRFQNPDLFRREALHAALLGLGSICDSWLKRFYAEKLNDGHEFGDLWFCNAQAEQLLSKLELPLQVAILEPSLYHAWRRDWPADSAYRYAYQLTLAHPESPEVQRLIEQVCWHAMVRGKFDDFQRQHQIFIKLALTPMEPIVAAMHGDFPTALIGFEAFLKEYRSAVGRRKVTLPSLSGLIYTISLIVKNDAPSIKRAHEQIKDSLEYGNSNAYYFLQGLLMYLQTGKVVNFSGLASKSLTPFEFLFASFARYWANDKFAPEERDALLKVRDSLIQNSYLWIAAEFDVLAQRMFDTARVLPDWHANHQLAPLVDAVQHQASWQHALTALMKLKGDKGDGLSANAGDARLLWLVGLHARHMTITPAEQKKGSKGNWNKWRNIGLKRFVNDPSSLPPMLEADRRIANLTRVAQDSYYGHYNDFQINAEQALLELIGHPHVYWLDSDNLRIDIVKAEFTLQLKQKRGEIELKLDPVLNTEGDVYWCKETPSRIAVYSVSNALRTIAGIIGDGVRIPETAKAELVATIAVIAPHLAVHSDLPEMAAHIDTIAADGTLYAHLLPLKDGLRLQFLVRPVPDGTWFAPGKGAANVLGEKDGKALQASRELKKEKAQLRQVLDSCTALALAEQDGEEWQFTHPQDCLEILSQLKEIPSETMQMVWPEGERFRLRGSRSMKNMRMGIKQQGDWFVADGEIELDDGRILALRELIQLCGNQQGRFLHLGNNDYLALTETMRKRLAELQAFGDFTGKEGVRINPLAAPALAEMAAEAGKLEADAAWRAQVKKLDALAEFQPVLPSTLQAQLRDYQLQGFEWLARLAQWGVGACLADDMGLGKTVQALALLLLRAPGGPALVVAPISVAMNWQTEVARFAPTLKVRAFHENRSLQDLGAFDVVIVSYTMLQIEAEAFAVQHWHTVVLDEAQVIKNAATKRSQAAMALQADFKMIASGTPVENHLGELWNLFRFINPGLLGSKERFNERFAAPIERGEKAARQHLKKLIQPFILRRTKTQVMSELPSRTEITLPIPLSSEERHLYEALRQEAIENLSQLSGAENKALHVLAAITKLRRFCCHPQLVMKESKITGSKLAVFGEVVQELLDNQHKALVFSQFTDHLAIVRAWLDDNKISYQYLDGSTAPLERKKRVDAFQAGQGDVFLISLKAGGTGLNLTAADYVIHLDPWWNPAVEDQASDRAHRMGQQRPVTIYRLVTEATIEEKIIALHAEKRDLADSLLDGGDTAGKLDTALLLQLLKSSALETDA